MKASLDSAQAATGATAARRQQDHREGAQPQRHDDQPERGRDGGGDQRAARLGEQQGEQQHAHRRVGERAAEAAAVARVRRATGRPEASSAAMPPRAFQ